MNSGYCGYSMSNRAVEAYDNGEMPASHWSKSYIISEVMDAVDGKNPLFNPNTLNRYLKDTLFRMFLRYTAYHHTGKYCNCTDFYALISLEEMLEITEEDLINYNEYIKESKKEEQKKKAEANIPEVWYCCYLEWSGTRKHPKAEKVYATGLIKGNTFYAPDVTKRITSNGFEKVKKGIIVDENSKEYHDIVRWNYDSDECAEYVPAQVCLSDPNLVKVKFLEKNKRIPSNEFMLKSEVLAHPDVWQYCQKSGCYYHAKFFDRFNGVIIDENCNEYHDIVRWNYDSDEFAEYVPAQVCLSDPNLVEVKYLMKYKRIPSTGLMLKSEVLAHPDDWHICPKCGGYYHTKLFRKNTCYYFDGKKSYYVYLPKNISFVETENDISFKLPKNCEYRKNGYKLCYPKERVDKNRFVDYIALDYKYKRNFTLRKFGSGGTVLDEKIIGLKEFEEIYRKFR